MKKQAIISLFALTASICLFLKLDAQVVIDPLTSLARDFANQTTEQIMKSICPNTGKDAHATVSLWEYDPRKKEFTITMESRWTGATCGFCTMQPYWVSGILRVKSDGTQAHFTQSYSSQSVIDTVNAWKWVKGGAVALAALAVLSQSDY